MTTTPHPAISEAREAVDHIHSWEDLDFTEQRKLITTALDLAESQAAEIERIKAKCQSYRTEIADGNVRHIEYVDRAAIRERDLASQVAGLTAERDAYKMASKDNADWFDNLKSDYDRLKAALESAEKVIGQIGRMKCFPDAAINMTTLSAAIQIAAQWSSLNALGER